MVNLEKAKEIVLAGLPQGTNITAFVEEGDDFLFLAIRPDPHEGRFDPFFKVNRKTAEFRDFSPLDYKNSREILDKLRAQTK